ncbi:LiaI-LiaF-like domain-containing protein [Proteiniphilum sp.]|uniref:LiaI-LiaF-like domain-containing protein n=1 Tax=Proteiniphilum sp. TaxID=1926877 RepID=UPI002B209A39|nr:DUF5668 domain-containing protein [Proteiniphilum sp.]MEA4917568.1 DUF5668 domain-containing protein [Proteiniphilum sp.]
METFSSSSSHVTRTKSVLFGLLLVVAGLLFLSFNFGWIDPALRPVLFSWPMIFIVIGIIGFSKSNYIVSLFWLILGIFFLLPRIAAAYPDSIQGLNSDFAYTYWPLLLIFLGVALILKVLFAKHRKKERDPYRYAETTERVSGSAEGGENGRIERSVVFGGSESIFLDPVFYGGEISALFGGVVLDLRRTQLPEGITYLDVDAVFGGVELHIPGDWLVETKFQTILGGMQDKRLVSPPDNSRKLIIKGDLIFGGCEIR